MTRIEVPRYLLIGSENGIAQVYEASDNLDACLDVASTGGADWHGILDRFSGDLLRGLELGRLINDWRDGRENDRAHDADLLQFYRGAK